MYQVSDSDVEAIKTWIEKEPYLPNTFDDAMLKKFLFSCEGSLERTKRCIEEFSTRRAGMPEVYTGRDPLSQRMQTVFSITTVTTYMADKDEILIHQLSCTPDNFDFYDCVKAFTIQADNWLMRDLDVLPENHIIVLDMQYYTLKIITKCNIFYLQKFLIFMLESMPVRLKHVHLINCPSFCDYVYNLVKPALPDYICNMIHFHPDHTGLYKFVNKKYLPKDYGGDCESLAEQNTVWVTDIGKKRKLFLDDNFWKADLSKKQKASSEGGGVDTQMSGSFRTLAID